MDTDRNCGMEIEKGTVRDVGGSKNGRDGSRWRGLGRNLIALIEMLGAVSNRVTERVRGNLQKWRGVETNVGDGEQWGAQA